MEIENQSQDTPPGGADRSPAPPDWRAAFGRVADPTWVRSRGRFVAEGRRVVAEVLATVPERVEALLLTPAARAALGDALAALPAGTPVVGAGGPAEVASMTGHRFHQGCLALVRLPPPRDPEVLIAEAAGPGGRLLVLEGVSDPDNVGTLLRSADAFGAGGALLASGSAHPLYRKALRTSLGAALRVPWAFDVPWPEALELLARRGFVRVALTPAPRAVDLRRAAPDLRRRPVALLLGAEGRGLSDAALQAADVVARIAMRPGADSLNVAAAGAVALHALLAPPRDG